MPASEMVSTSWFSGPSYNSFTLSNLFAKHSLRKTMINLPTVNFKNTPPMSGPACGVVPVPGLDYTGTHVGYLKLKHIQRDNPFAIKTSS